MDKLSIPIYKGSNIISPATVRWAPSGALGQLASHGTRLAADASTTLLELGQNNATRTIHSDDPLGVPGASIMEYCIQDLPTGVPINPTPSK